MPWPLSIAAFIAVLFAAWAGTAAAITHLRRQAFLDHPNERSSHGIPTPRGGGVAVVPAILAGWSGVAALGLPAAPGLALSVAIGAASLLAALSWIDDRRGLPPLPRLFAQIVAVAAGIAALPTEGAVFQGLLPPLADRLVAGILWVWFVNLFNFMDGIDGLAGMEAVSIGLGLVLIVILGRPIATGAGIGLAALVVMAAALGFLWWNWHPARIFLGDVGSVPIGYLIGWLLLRAASEGLWVAAVILPLYFLADATVTLARRLAGGHMPWDAHRTHYYQRALRQGLGHADVVRRIAAVNAVLIGLALAGEGGYPAYTLAGAALMVGALLWAFGRGGTAAK